MSLAPSHTNQPEADQPASGGLPETGLPFAKMTGSGNDFVVIDNRARCVADRQVAAFTRAVCQRGLGIGADGVVLIDEPSRPDAGAHFRWRYINADGTDGEMCGNGAMCGARFAVRSGIAPGDCRFETESGLVHAIVGEGGADPMVRIGIADPGPLADAIAVDVAGESFVVAWIRAGVPHVVLTVPDADSFGGAAGFAAFGRAVRNHPAFAPEGTNVNVIHRIDGQTLRMRTWERGVEAETLACGTGAIAAAIVGVAQGLVNRPVTVITSSGRPLQVDFAFDGDRATGVTLGGEARFIATGTLDPEGWR